MERDVNSAPGLLQAANVVSPFIIAVILSDSRISLSSASRRSPGFSTALLARHLVSLSLRQDRQSQRIHAIGIVAKLDVEQRSVGPRHVQSFVCKSIRNGNRVRELRV